ncbi:hypothetical protein MID13_07680 [Vibrio gigantis]|uniref:hypothetical protein n=1 Tax=Vibrio gigantis TaxID=296199 RepID=UPI001EFAC288|nr:hypothetical protein [Vibrio gigantis]ULN65663.1 hypothetical protein MID13_07680 [Vibrio gigantis]
MYGSEQTRAFCCNCKELTLHKYTMFSNQAEKAPKDDKKSGLLGMILSSLASSGGNGDYKCIKCGTNLRTPDNLD